MTRLVEKGPTCSQIEGLTSFLFLQRIQELLVSMLTGQNERLTFRPFTRSSYGQLLDFAATGDGVSLVHDQLADLKALLTEMRGGGELGMNAPPLAPVPE